MLNYDHLRGMECLSYKMFKVSSGLFLRMPADACETSQQSLPLASEEVHSRPTAVFFEAA